MPFGVVPEAGHLRFQSVQIKAAIPTNACRDLASLQPMSGSHSMLFARPLTNLDGRPKLILGMIVPGFHFPDQWRFMAPALGWPVAFGRAVFQ